MHVLAREQGQEFRVGEVVAPREGDQGADRLDGRQCLQVQRPLGGADVGVALLEDGEEELVLALVVVIDELLVDAGAFGDGLDAGAAEAVVGELAHRRAQDLLAAAIGVSRTDFDDLGCTCSHDVIIHQSVN